MAILVFQGNVVYFIAIRIILWSFGLFSAILVFYTDKNLATLVGPRNACVPGLPDGLFSNQKYKFWYKLEGLGMENAVIFYALLEYFTAIWYN
jgi:hypothetical protein